MTEKRVIAIFNEEIKKHNIPSEDRVREIIAENNAYLLSKIKVLLKPLHEDIKNIYKILKCNNIK